MADAILRVRKTIKKVNRIFLIGNGFDLALGLKTKYSDFLLWLLKKEIVKAIDSGIYEAPFPKYKGRYNQIYRAYDKLKVDGYSENKLFDVLIEYQNYKRNLNDVIKIDNLKQLFNLTESLKIKINVIHDKMLMSGIIDTSRDNWVDIENIYFELLKQIVKNKQSQIQLDKINILNDELTLLADYLKEYLKSFEVKINKNDAIKYFEQFNENLKPNDFLEIEPEKFNLIISSSYFLNFNYTNSVDVLLSHFKQFNYIENHIHNSLEDDNLIFGFGDEMDSIYKEIEELNDNRFFKHIKSFHYFKTPKQRNLQSFLNAGDYQVCVYGHSCGLSDRVMLNEIFEHENCKSIKIYYYNDEDFTTKTMEISRHFNSNQTMRKKIVEKSADCLIHQVKKS